MPGIVIHSSFALDVLDRWSRQGNAPFDAGDAAVRNALLNGAMGPDMGMFPGGCQLMTDAAHFVQTADLARTPAINTLINIARKGRAFGVSLIVATQHPTADVINSQIKANLPIAIAFQTRTHSESQTILGRKGAETLDRPGLALTFIGGQWKKVQTLRVGQTAAQAIVGQVSGPSAEVLSPVERDLVRYAVEHLDGAFTVGKLYQAVDGISKYALTRLARAWEHRGWLTEPARTSEGHKVGRTVTPELASLALDTGDRDIVTSVTRRDMAPKIVTRPAASRDVAVMV